MLKHLVSISLFSLLVLDATVALADSTQNHHCKLHDGSIDMKKTHKECEAAKGEWAADAATPTAPTKETAKPSTPAAPAAPATSSRDVVKPAPPTTPAKPTAPVGYNTQNHHCRMPDNTMDPKKTHKECDVAKGQWSKDSETGTTAPVRESTQDHHCRMPDKSIDVKKTHKECEAARGEWAKDADAK